MALGKHSASTIKEAAPHLRTAVKAEELCLGDLLDAYRAHPILADKITMSAAQVRGAIVTAFYRGVLHGREQKA